MIYCFSKRANYYSTSFSYEIIETLLISNVWQKRSYAFLFNKSLASEWKLTRLFMQICKIFVILGLKILILLRLKVVFEADIIKR